jgi:hypothetical protein
LTEPWEGNDVSKQRVIDTCFWDDTYVRRLDPSEKFVFLYLLTNPLTNIAGVYEIGIDRIAFDTGYNVKTVGEILSRLEWDGKCLHREGWIAIRNWIKHQVPSPKVAAGIDRQLSSVPKAMSEYARTGAIPYAYPIVPNLTKPNLTKPNLAEDSPVPSSPVRKAKPKHSPEDIALHKELGDWFVEHGGHWPAGGKEAVSLYRLIDWARKEHAAEHADFLRGFLDAILHLRDGSLYGMRPFDRRRWGALALVPSVVLSQAANLCAVMAQLGDANRPLDPELEKYVEVKR